MGRAKEQDKLIKLCVANYWLWLVIVFEPTIFLMAEKSVAIKKGV